MPRYNYVARDLNGTIYRGIIQAVGKNEVRRRLKQRGFYATSVKTMREWNLKFRRRVKKGEVAVFAEQLATMVDSGLTLIRCIDTVLDQTKNRELTRVLREVKQDVENGITFSEALRKHPKIFPPLFISMVMAGETGGTLAKSLRQLADYMDKEQETKQKVKSALAYPKIVAFVGALVIFALITFIIPRFAQIYKQLGVTLPLITRILVGTSMVVSRFWWMILLGGILIYVIFNRLKTVPAVKAILDKISLNVPVFGSLNRKVLVSRFIRILSTLLPNGVPIMQSLNVVEEVVDNKVLDRVIDGVRTSISSGGGLSEPISASYVFPSMVVQMIGIGEETGRLGSLLEKSSVYLDREIDTTIKNLITRIEPIMTIILAGVVAVIALSIYLPLFGIFEAL